MSEAPAPTVNKDGEETVEERLKALVSCGDDFVKYDDHEVCMGTCGGWRVC